MKFAGVGMRLRKRGAIFSYRFGNPIIAKPEVIVAIRRVVQNACRHEDVKAIDADGLRTECVECGQQMLGLDIAQLVRVAQ
jgi:hypothetical protein